MREDPNMDPRVRNWLRDMVAAGVNLDEGDGGRELLKLAEMAVARPMDKAEFTESLERYIASHKGQYTAKRGLVMKIASQEPARALGIARSITKPWYRCQALAHAALHVNDAVQRDAILRESFDAALEMTGEFNRIVCVSAWPLSVLCERRQWEDARREANRLVGIIAEEPSPVRRANALLELAKAVWDAPDDLLRLVLEPLVVACLQPLMSGDRNRRGESWLVSVMPAIYRCSAEWANEVAGRIVGPALRAEAGAVLAKLDRNEETPCVTRG